MRGLHDEVRVRVGLVVAHGVSFLARVPRGVILAESEVGSWSGDAAFTGPNAVPASVLRASLFPPVCPPGPLASLTMFSKKKKRIEISAPSNFEHRVHTGYDQQEQKFTGLPRQWQGIIEESAKRPKPLVDPVCITAIQHGSQKVGSSSGRAGGAAFGARKPRLGFVPPSPLPGVPRSR